MTIFQTWCHAVSVGESLQRTELRNTRWDQIIVTISYDDGDDVEGNVYVIYEEGPDDSGDDEDHYDDDERGQ